MVDEVGAPVVSLVPLVEVPLVEPWLADPVDASVVDVPVELEVSAIHCGLEVSTKRHKCGADITATIRRSEWGLKKYVPFVADEVRLTIPVEAYRAER